MLKYTLHSINKLRYSNWFEPCSIFPPLYFLAHCSIDSYLSSQCPAAANQSIVFGHQAWNQMSHYSFKFPWLTHTPSAVWSVPVDECQKMERGRLWPRVIFTYVMNGPARWVGGQSMTMRRYCQGRLIISTSWQVKVGGKTEVRLQPGIRQWAGWIYGGFN